MTGKKKKRALAPGDVVAEHVNPSLCARFRSLELRATFIRREMERIESDRKELWDNLISAYKLDVDKHHYNLDFAKGVITLGPLRGQDEPAGRRNRE